MSADFAASAKYTLNCGRVRRFCGRLQTYCEKFFDIFFVYDILGGEIHSKS